MLVTDHKQIDKYYEALLARDQKFVGIFYVGVKTTGIFCMATCRARKPKRTNVEFYTSFKEPLVQGYRPCKICKPTEHAHKAPDQVLMAIDLVKKSPKKKITDVLLEEAGIRPEFVRRWFNKHHGMTFHAYQRMFRINHAYQELKGGKNTTATAFDMGYESLSGFGYTFKKLLGKSPSKSLNKNIILISRLETPLGPMFACATDKGLCLLEFVDREILEKEFKDLQKLLGASILAGENQHIKQTKIELAEYFAGQRKIFTVPLDMPGTSFRQSVWKALLEVPFGETRFYQEQAEFIKKPDAVRAVAAANGANRIAIMVPCHRVIGKNGKLTGYGGGIEKKKWLLEHEGVIGTK